MEQQADWVTSIAMDSMNKSETTSTWGLVASPGGSILATITTAQPTDAVVFTTTASATCTIRFAQLDVGPNSHIDKLKNLKGFSTEALVFEATYGDYNVGMEEFPYRKKLLRAESSLAMHIPQSCVFCGAVITLTDEENSSCSNGHVFGK